MAKPKTKTPKSKPAPPAPTPAPISAAIAAELRAALEFPHKGLDTLLPDVSYVWAAPGLTVEGCFHYVMIRDGVAQFTELLKLMYDRIPYFCLSRKERKDYQDKYDADKDLKHMSQMLEKAKKLLIRKEGSKKTVGEPGEILLFLLLEAVLKAPQMACKMSLKTSQEMPVHGSDAIHLKFDPATDTMTLLWGESKLYSKLSSALDEVCASIEDFRKCQDGKTPRERDISILCDHMNMTDPATKAAIAKYFDPYEPAFKNMREVHTCFVGFDFSFFSKLASFAKDKAEEEFKNEYLDRVKEACALFADKINSKKLHTLRFHFFLIPFESVETFRMGYLEKLKG